MNWRLNNPDMVSEGFRDADYQAIPTEFESNYMAFKDKDDAFKCIVRDRGFNYDLKLFYFPENDANPSAAVNDFEDDRFGEEEDFSLFNEENMD